MQYIMAIVVSLLGVIAYLFTKNQELKSDGKLSDSKVKDAKLETKQDDLHDAATKIQETLRTGTVEKVNPDQSAEDFWKEKR